MTCNTKHGWYSAKMAACIQNQRRYNDNDYRDSPTVYYRHADGHAVEVTHVSSSATDPASKWEDEVYVGPVTEFLGDTAPTC